MQQVVSNAEAAQRLLIKKRQYIARQHDILEFGKKRVELLELGGVDIALRQSEVAHEGSPKCNAPLLPVGVLCQYRRQELLSNINNARFLSPSDSRTYSSSLLLWR